MNTTQPTPGRASKAQSFVAFTAIVVSVCALVVSFYQARIMRETQKAAVWPFVEILPSNTATESFLGIYNKGTGPAIIKSVTLSIDDQSFTTWNALFDHVAPDDTIPFAWSTVRGRVLAPNDVVKAIELQPENARKVGAAISSLQFELCYCSVYDDCWTTSLARNNKPIDRCTVDEELGFQQ